MSSTAVAGPGAARRRQPRQHRERLEGGVPGKTKVTIGQSLEHQVVLRVITDQESNGNAGVQQT